MKKILLLLLMLIYSKAYSQIEDYKEYQHHINTAELKLVKNEKNESLDLYFSTLKESNGNFVKDIYNALLLSSELSKIDTFFSLLDLLLPKGLNNEYINEIDEFKWLHKETRWKNFLIKNKDHPNINKELKSKIDGLLVSDQLFREKEGSYEVYGDTINKIDSLNIEYLFYLIASNKFPGEDEIGVKDFLGTQGYDIVFHHYTQTTSTDKKKSKITPILINLVLEGKLLPNKCSHWLEMQNGEFKAGVFDVMNFKINGKETNYYVPNYTFGEKTLINEYRKWLGMESLDEYYEKFLYKINQPASKFIFDIRRSTIEANKEMFEIFTVKLKMKELK